MDSAACLEPMGSKSLSLGKSSVRKPPVPKNDEGVPSADPSELVDSRKIHMGVVHKIVVQYLPTIQVHSHRETPSDLGATWTIGIGQRFRTGGNNFSWRRWWRKPIFSSCLWRFPSSWLVILSQSYGVRPPCLRNNQLRGLDQVPELDNPQPHPSPTMTNITTNHQHDGLNAAIILTISQPIQIVTPPLRNLWNSYGI